MGGYFSAGVWKAVKNDHVTGKRPAPLCCSIPPFVLGRAKSSPNFSGRHKPISENTCFIFFYKYGFQMDAEKKQKKINALFFVISVMRFNVFLIVLYLTGIFQFLSVFQIHFIIYSVFISSLKEQVKLMINDCLYFNFANTRPV